MRPPRHGRVDEAGSVTLWLVIMTVALLAAAGLVYDGGQALALKGMAINDAAGAARAGAEALDQAAFVAGGNPSPDPSAATAAAMTFLDQAGVPAGDATVSVSGALVSVTVHLTWPPAILSAVGAGTFHVSGSGAARAVYGVRGPLS